MTPKTKAILKTAGIALAGAAAFAYLPLVSFAVAPQAMGWIHMGLAAFHPLLGEALLGVGCLAGMGVALKRTWGNYFAEKKLEKKIEQIVAQKVADRQEKTLAQQKQNTKEKQFSYDNKDKEDIQQVENLTTQKRHAIKHSDAGFKRKVFGIFRGRQNYRDAA